MTKSANWPLTTISLSLMVAPIAGLAPPQLAEVPSMTVWPTIGSTRIGRLVGRLCGIGWGWGFFTLGKLLAILTIPLSLAAFAWLLAPLAARRYRLTNRRIVVQHGLSGKEIRASAWTSSTPWRKKFSPVKPGSTRAISAFSKAATRFSACRASPAPPFSARFV